MKFILGFLAGFILCSQLGCTSVPKTLEALGEYPILRGYLVGEPVFEAGGKRMFIYLEVESEVEGVKEVFACMAVNEEKRTVLADIKDRLMAAVGEPVFIYGYAYNKAYEEVINGVDFYVVAVGFYTPPTQKYQYRIANWSQSTRDALRNISWGKFIKKLGKAAINKVL